MKYPDGTAVCEGDLVWWNEGDSVGYVQIVLEEKNEYESWGFDHPHFMIANCHPFDPSIRTGVTHNEEILEDEGVGKLNEIERKELSEAIEEYRRSNRIEETTSISVRTIGRENKFCGWRFDH